MNDYGETDSQIVRIQKKFQEKAQKYVDKFDNESRIREMRQRWESGKGKKKTFWEKIKEWITK
jgi:arginyl-tRNA synthetase